MFRTFYKSCVVTVWLAVILCVAYPLAVWAIGKIFFSHRADGSLIEQNGKVIGSSLIGQSFSKPQYLHGRPSSAGDKGYDSMSSSGSNLGPTSQKLIQAVQANVKAVIQENPGLQSGKVPVDLVTASASGLDPHISPRAAEVQIARIAGARKVDAEKIREVIARHTEQPLFGVFGDPVVNVLETNVDLDQTVPAPAR
jgi:K+-transporting ATPase ATPase C chain